MNPRTTLALLACVLVLGGLVYWQTRREERAQAALDFPLFEGVVAERVVALRIEHAALDDHLRIERDAQRRWRITDPEALPAESAFVDHLLNAALTHRATPVPDAEADAVKLLLEPPRFVLEIEESIDGAPRRSRLEVGAVDPDQQRVNVRIGGRILRTWRDLETALARPREEYRSHRIVEVDPNAIVEVHRRGVFTGFDGKERDSALDALAEDGVWRATAPLEGVLDPLGMSIVTGGIARLTGLAYLDLGNRPLAEFGLDPPEATVRVATTAGGDLVLRLGRRGHQVGETWACALEGRPHVFALESANIEILLAPAEALLDHKLWRVTRTAIETVELTGGGRVLELVREPKRWAVRQKLAGEDAFGPLVTAERARVEDLLAQLEGLELLGFEPGLALQDDAVAGALRVTAQGARQGGVLSAPEPGATGARTVRFRRDGDRAVARADALLFDAATRPIEEFQSLMVQELVEVEQRGLALSDGVKTRRWVRGAKGQWVREGASSEARELHAVLDPLLFLRAERHLSAKERVELVESIAVTFLDVNDTPHVVVVAKPAGGALPGETLLQCEGRLSLAREKDLHARLEQLLAD
ncbi:MAG: DUF4340 domain-containing protein [Planctomycetes bacterium]|nr:DUF4340 domain-containing protein [Planctomycetota bacterium]